MDRVAPDRFLAGIEARAFRMAEIATGSRDDALDLVQDAMIKLVERYATRPEQEWKPLFYRILQNRIRDWGRRRSFRAAFTAILRRPADDGGLADPIESQPGGITDPEEEAGKARTLARIQAALRSLPRRQREAFLLRAWEGLAVAETATAMGCSAGSVKTHYHRALRALRSRLAEDLG